MKKTNPLWLMILLVMLPQFAETFHQLPEHLNARTPEHRILELVRLREVDGILILDTGSAGRTENVLIGDVVPVLQS